MGAFYGWIEEEGSRRAKGTQRCRAIAAVGRGNRSGARPTGPGHPRPSCRCRGRHRIRRRPRRHGWAVNSAQTTLPPAHVECAEPQLYESCRTSNSPRPLSCPGLAAGHGRADRGVALVVEFDAQAPLVAGQCESAQDMTAAGVEYGVRRQLGHQQHRVAACVAGQVPGTDPVSHGVPGGSDAGGQGGQTEPVLAARRGPG